MDLWNNHLITSIALLALLGYGANQFGGAACLAGIAIGMAVQFILSPREGA